MFLRDDGEEGLGDGFEVGGVGNDCRASLFENGREVAVNVCDGCPVKRSESVAWHWILEQK